MILIPRYYVIKELHKIFNYFRRADNSGFFAEPANPREELIADFNVCVQHKMSFAVRSVKHLVVLYNTIPRAKKKGQITALNL